MLRLVDVKLLKMMVNTKNLTLLLLVLTVHVHEVQSYDLITDILDQLKELRKEVDDLKHIKNELEEANKEIKDEIEKVKTNTSTTCASRLINSQNVIMKKEINEIKSSQNQQIQNLTSQVRSLEMQVQQGKLIFTWEWTHPGGKQGDRFDFRIDCVGHCRFIEIIVSQSTGDVDLYGEDDTIPILRNSFCSECTKCKSDLSSSEKDQCKIDISSTSTFYFTLYASTRYSFNKFSELKVVVEATNMIRVVCIEDNCGGKTTSE